MSEKARDFWWDVKDRLGIVAFFVGIVLFTAALVVIMLLLSALISGIFFTICWNVIMPFLFNFDKITLIQSIILLYAIAGARSGYLREFVREYRKLKVDFEQKNMNYAAIVAFGIVFFVLAISLCISGLSIMYSWNTILPHLFNIELAKINFIHAICFSYVFSCIFGKSSIQKSEKEENNKKKDDGDVIVVDVQDAQ